MEVERIKFERTGGFAGTRIAADLKLEDLPEEQAQTLLDLLDDLEFEELPERISGSMIRSDEVFYTVTVDAKKWKHTVMIEESSASEKLKEFLQYLLRVVRKRKKMQ